MKRFMKKPLSQIFIKVRNASKVRLGRNTQVSEVISSRQSNPILNSMVIDDNEELLFATTKESVSYNLG